VYRILLLNGKHKGKTIDLREGENYIGRTDDNDIVLPSSSISKKHCCITVNNQSIEIQDLNSANGLFINGVKSDHEYLKKGSKISLGDFIFEIKENIHFPAISMEPKNLSTENLNKNEIQKYDDSFYDQAPPASSSGVDKALWHVEKKVMPFFYQMNKKYEWKSIALGMFAIFIILSVSLSVFPLLKENERSIIAEAQKRARLLAMQIVDDNVQFLLRDEETKTKITNLAKNKTIKLAVLTDLNGRIIAPAEYFNQIVVSPLEARMLKRVSELYQLNPDAMGISVFLGDHIVAAAEPVKLHDPSFGRNKVVAISLVSMDISNELFSFSDLGVHFFSALILVVLISLFIIYPFYRLLIKRFEDMNKEVDKILKGEQKEISTHYKFEEISPLIDVLNSAFQRISSGSENGLNFSQNQSASITDMLPFFNSLGRATHSGVMAFNSDFEVIYMNEVSEEITGITFINNENKKIFEIARDEAFSSFMQDLFNQLGSSATVADKFEFSGIAYNIDANIIGKGRSSGYVLLMTRENLSSMDEAI